MSDLERAQEWLGCHIRPDSTWCEEHALPWPCPEATRLAALLAETRADEYERWRVQWESRWTPPAPFDYECCASGRCEVCRG